MTQRKSVALLLETSNAYSRGLLDGIITFVQQHAAWSVYLPEQGRGAAPPDWLKNWKGDGIIARIETQAIANAVCRTRLPIVDVSAARHIPDIPWIETNDFAIAELAAEHLISRGFSNLAFCGDPAFNWSQWREQRFSELVVLPARSILFISRCRGSIRITRGIAIVFSSRNGFAVCLGPWGLWLAMTSRLNSYWQSAATKAYEFPKKLR